MEQHAAPGSAIHRILYGPYGLRAGWRIAAFLLLFLGATSVVGTIVTGLAGSMGRDASFALLLVTTLLAGWAMMALVERRRPGAMGFALGRAAIRDSIVGLGIGGALLGAAVLLLAVAGMARWVADTGSTPEYVAALTRWLAFFAVAAAWEEALFRGYPFQALVQGIGAWPAVLLSSALFAAAHAANPNVTPVALANIFLAGVMLAVAYLRTRSLWFATGVHLGWNWVMAAVVDLPVSGFEIDTPLYEGSETGPDWLTGGTFGPEAGFVATVVILLGTVWLWRTRRIGESARMRELRPLVDDRIGADGWR